MGINNQEREFLLAVYEATSLDKLKWSICEDSNAEIFSCDISGNELTFEFLYMQPFGSESSIRAAVLITGLSTYFHAFAGTEQFNIAINTLSLQVPGWKAGLNTSNRQIEKAIEAIRGLLA